MSDEDIGDLFSDDLDEYSRPSSFAGLCIAVWLICGKIIVVIFVHRGIGPLLFHRCSCADAWSNTQQPTSAHLSQ
jgi:hypothetical protein